MRLGRFTNHMVGSLHLYDRDRQKVAKYRDEGLQRTDEGLTEMPAMGPGPQWGSIKRLFVIESGLRLQGGTALAEIMAEIAELDPYWADVARLFAIYALTKGRSELPRADLRQVVSLRRSMTTDFYNTYIRRRAERLERAVADLDLLTGSVQ